MWLEQLARGTAASTEPIRSRSSGGELDFRPLLLAVAQDRVRGRDVGEIARSFHRGIAQGLCDAVNVISRSNGWIRLCSPEESSRTSCCWKI